jgi:hypothetical protein
MRPCIARWSVIPLLVVVGLTAAACDKHASPVDPTVPQPAIASITPSVLQPSDAPQTITFAGAGFDGGMQLLVTAPDGTGTTVPATSLQAIQPTGFQATVLLTQTGTYTFIVRNGSGASSPPLTTVVQPAGSVLPVAYVVTPPSVPRGNQGTVVSLQGVNFAPNASVMITDPNGMVMVLTAPQLSSLTPTNIQFTFTFAVRGNYSLVVLNPNGDSSNPIAVAVT